MKRKDDLPELKSIVIHEYFELRFNKPLLRKKVQASKAVYKDPK